uniref:Uncharacterized protein n=1 Tax=Solanum tuberosum TaxID=4113 RepID=M1DGT5_SOLTU
MSVMLGPFGESPTAFSRQGLALRKLQCTKGTKAQTKGDQRRPSESHQVHSANSGFSSNVTEPKYTFSTTLKAIWGTLANRRVVQRAQPSSPNDPCLLSTHLPKFNTAAAEK